MYPYRHNAGRWEIGNTGTGTAPREVPVRAHDTMQCAMHTMRAHDVPGIILNGYGMKEIRGPRPAVIGRHDIRKRIDRSITAGSESGMMDCL